MNKRASSRVLPTFFCVLSSPWNKLCSLGEQGRLRSRPVTLTAAMPSLPHRQHRVPFLLTPLRRTTVRNIFYLRMPRGAHKHSRVKNTPPSGRSHRRQQLRRDVPQGEHVPRELFSLFVLRGFRQERTRKHGRRFFQGGGGRPPRIVWHFSLPLSRV